MNSPIEEKQEEVEKKNEWSPIVDYLKSAGGHEVISSLVGVFAAAKKSDAKHKTYLYVLQGFVFATSIIAASLLTYYDKFNPPMALLFGTMVGYFFGRRGDSN